MQCEVCGISMTALAGGLGSHQAKGQRPYPPIQDHVPRNSFYTGEGVSLEDPPCQPLCGAHGGFSALHEQGGGLALAHILSLLLRESLTKLPRMDPNAAFSCP